MSQGTHTVTDRVTGRAAHVLLNEVETAIVGHKGSNLLPVLDELHTCTLTNGRVGLLGLNTTAIRAHTELSKVAKTKSSQHCFHLAAALATLHNNA